MSFHSWHTYGYGIRVSGLKCDSVERLKAALHLAPELEKNIERRHVESGTEITSVEDYFEDDEDYSLGLAAIMKGIIMETEGINFTVCSDFEGDAYLLYEAAYPWRLTDTEKEMTEEKADKILLKYFSLITDDAVEADYCDPENGG
jgi:hypothetical protein